MTAEAVLFWIPLSGVVAAVVLALIADLFGRRALAAATAGSLLFAAGGWSLVQGWGSDPIAIGNAFVAGSAASTVTGVVLLLAALSVVSAFGSRAQPASTTALVSAAAGGSVAVVFAADVVALLLGVEIVAVACYAIVGSSRNGRADEAALKYFIQGAVATALFVIGAAAVMAATTGLGTYSSIAAAVVTPQGAALCGFGVLLVMMALAFKAGAAPFHSWVPDAYETAPHVGAAAMGGPVKLAMIAAFITVVTTIAPAGSSAGSVLGVLGPRLLPVAAALSVLSVLVGALLALRSASYTRIIAYGGVSQVGYALIAVAALSRSAAIVFAVTYAVGATGAYAAAAAFRRMRPNWDGTVAGIAGLGRESGLLGLSVTVVLASLAGIPPLLGFWGKFQAIGVAIARGTALMNLAGQAGPEAGTHGVTLMVGAAIAVLGSIVSLGYYGAILRSLFFDRAGGAPAEDGRAPTPGPPGVVVATIALFILVTGALPLAIGFTAAIAGFLPAG